MNIILLTRSQIFRGIFDTLRDHADIRGTSPKVWNQWKGKLLADLYYQTLHHLSQGEPPAPHGIIAERQAEAMRLLRFFPVGES